MFLIFLCTPSVPKQRTTTLNRGPYRVFNPLQSAKVCGLPEIIKCPDGKSCTLGSRTGRDRTVVRNHWSALPPISLAPVHCRGNSSRSPTAQGARTCMQMLEKTRVFWVWTSEEFPMFRRSVISPASEPNTRHLWRLESSSAPL